MSHFTSFTAEAMRAFGQKLDADANARGGLLSRMRDQTSAMLAAFRKDQEAAERGRRASAQHGADQRRRQLDEMRAGVHAMMGRFAAHRSEMADDLREMAGELRAAASAFHERGRSAPKAKPMQAKPMQAKPMPPQPMAPQAKPTAPPTQAAAPEAPKAHSKPEGELAPTKKS